MNLGKRFIPSEKGDTFHWGRFTIPYRHLAAGILCLGIVLRLLGLNKGLWLDEYFSLQVISSGDFLHVLRLQDKPPLFYLFYKLSSLVSMSEPLLRLTSVCFGIGTLALMMKWIRRFSLSASLVAGLLCTTLPIMLRYSQEIRGYSLLLCAAVCSFFFASRLSDAPQRSSGYIGLSLSLSVAVGTHLAGIMLMPAAIIFLAFSRKDLRKISLGKSLLAVALPSMFFLYLYLFFLYKLPDQEGWWMHALSFSSALSTMKEMLGISYLLAARDVVHAQSPFLAAAYTYVIESLLIWICITLVFFGDWRRSLPFLIAAICYWLELIIYSILAIPIFWYRIALPGLIPFIGFVALQIDGIRMKRVKAASLGGIVILCTIFTAGWAAHSAWVPYEQWRRLSESLKTQWTENDLVLFYPGYSEGLVRYYFPGLPSGRGVAVGDGNEIDRVARELQARMNRGGETVGKQTVFLIMRADMGIRKDLNTYRSLMSYLESECGPPAVSKEFGNLSFSKYGCHFQK